ncbi:MAG TPA: HAMP domain-containing sensor histidine kinase [Candidatus Binataceae bacterium]|nr:HAMP domain-containing sensor histidine kinase [Candidatus Binataceae bacterium]
MQHIADRKLLNTLPAQRTSPGQPGRIAANAPRDASQSGFGEPPGSGSSGPVAWTEEEEEAVRVLKVAGTVAIFMLLAQVVHNLFEKSEGQIQALIHLRWVLITGSCLFIALLWTNAFKRNWKLWTLSYFFFISVMVTATSYYTHNPETRFIVMALVPVVAVGFVSWGPRLQFAVGMMAVVCYAMANLLVPIQNRFHVYRWFGLLAAVLFSQAASFLVDRYRERLAAQVQGLEDAARFRENQIATMSHDIRSPAAALGGYANLLEDGEISAKERADLLARISATAWNIDLVVGNVLDYYDVEDRAIVPVPVELDPNVLIAEVARDCALQARRRGLTLRTEFSRLPKCRLDARHCERIVKNLLAFAMNRMVGGELQLHTASRDRWLVIDVTDNGARLSATEIQELFERPKDGQGGLSRGLGLYIARMMIEAAGGHLEERAGARGLTLIAELPVESIESKTDDSGQ